MIKISALNEESDDASGSEEEEVTREALEQIALAQYGKALELQRRGGDSTRAALALLKDLLDTELLGDVKKPEKGEKAIEPLFNLKYLCYKNIATIHTSFGETEEAIEAYCEAATLDDTDVSLWFRLGNLCLQSFKFDMALNAYQRGTTCNPKHWPCLDKIITLLLGLGHHNDCIAAIIDALKLDPDYLRGLAYRKYIYTEYPFILEYMTYVNPIYAWKPEQDEFDDKDAESLIKEAIEIRNKYTEQVKLENIKYILPVLKLQKPISRLTWENVGECLVHMHRYMTEHSYTHASKLEVVYEKEIIEEKMDVVNDLPECCEAMEAMEADCDENVNETEKSTPEKTEADKLESDPDNAQAGEIKIDNKEQKKPAVRRRGSALSFLEQWEWCTKRRSSRKKPQTKQDRGDETVYDTLRRLIPMSLTSEPQKKQEKPERVDDSPDTMDLYKLFEDKQISNTEVIIFDDQTYFGSELEQDEVNVFIQKFKLPNHDIIDILREYLMNVSKKWKMKWSDELKSVYVEANVCCSSHMDVPSYTEDNFDDLKFFVLVNLMSEEIIVNKKLQNNCDKEILSFDMINSLGLLINKPHIFDDECLEISLRYMWLKCHSNLYCKNNEVALDSLYQILCEFDGMGEHGDQFVINNVNFNFRPIINKADTSSLIKSLERNKRLSTVMGLYDMGNIEEALNILLDSFQYCLSLACKQELNDMSLDFAVQLSLILDCYWGLDKHELCFKWSVICLHESVKYYTMCTSGTLDSEKWSLVIVKALACLEHCLDTEGLLFIDLLSDKELSQVVEDIIQVIGHQVEETTSDEMPLDTVSPWIILYHILQREEDKGRNLQQSDNNQNDDIPNAIMILFVGHEQLGKKSWCMNAEAKLLYFILDTVSSRLRAPAFSKCVETLCQQLEQCVFCLFGHPSKQKVRLKYLSDHVVSPHKLDWPRAQQVYDIFKPSELPEIEGKLPSISADTEQLLQRIISLFPADCSPKKYLPDLVKYLDLKIDALPEVTIKLPFKMRDIFFLLGDYYFKKDERSKSMKYNLYDILINNDRFESWAEIALARATNLEVKLNSSANVKGMDCIIEGSSAIRCFKRALELDSMHCNLWIEYGVFVYGMHSFCSRLLKQDSESLSMDEFEAIERRKEEMLDTAQKCFTTVSQDLNNSDVTEDENDELWLHYYMLGKVAEKKNKCPKEYLNYYMQAAQHLFDNNATYPSKINYNTPQHLSIEALEVHYRIHATILKYIEQHENKSIMPSDGKVFQECLQKCANGPFSTKKRSKKDNSDDVDVEASKLNDEQTSTLASSAGIPLKRSVSDSGEETGQEAKKQKIETVAAKVRRSASYDIDRHDGKDLLETQNDAQKSATADNVVKQHSDNNETKENLQKKNITVPDKENVLNNASKQVKKKEDTSNSDSSSSGSSESTSDESTSDSSSSSGTDTTVKSVTNSKPLSEAEIMSIISMCLDALEDCVSRFPQHYKALYRLAHYHFYYRKGKDIERCRDLMLSNFISRNNNKLQGLFCERKNNNFFNSIWRIPVNEVDRAGSFSSHMSRCVLITMEILKEIDDHKTLLELSLTLSKLPEPDKKYLRDSEREELAQQAFSLCVQSLKGQVTKFSNQPDLKTNAVEKQTLNSLMLDIYRAYQKVQKQANSKQFTNLLVEAYKLICTIEITENTNLVDLSMKHCQSLIASLKQQATLASINSSNAKKSLTKSFEAAKVQQGQINPPIPKQDLKQFTPAPAKQHDDFSATLKSYFPMLNDSVLSQQTATALSLSYLSSTIGYPSYSNNMPPVSTYQTEYYNQLLSSLANSYPLPKRSTGGGGRGKKNYNKSVNTAGKVQKPTTSKSFTDAVPTSVIKSTDIAIPTRVSNCVAKPKPTTLPLSKPTSLPLSLPSSIAVTAISKPVYQSVTTAATPVISKSAPNSTSFNMNQIMTPTISPNLVTSMNNYGTSVQPAHMSSLASTSYAATSSGNAKPAHMTTTSTVSAALHTKPPLPHQQVSPGKTLQEKLAERQKHLPSTSTIGSVTTQDINSSISKLPSSLIVTKTSVSKPSQNFPEVPKLTDSVAKNTTSSDVIVLD